MLRGTDITSTVLMSLGSPVAACKIHPESIQDHVALHTCKHFVSSSYSLQAHTSHQTYQTYQQSRTTFLTWPLSTGTYEPSILAIKALLFLQGQAHLLACTVICAFPACPLIFLLLSQWIPPWRYSPCATEPSFLGVKFYPPPHTLHPLYLFTLLSFHILIIELHFFTSFKLEDSEDFSSCSNVPSTWNMLNVFSINLFLEKANE